MAIDTSTNPQPQENLQTGNTLSDAIVKKMLESSSMVSSTTSTIDERINQAMVGVKQSTEAGAGKIQSEFGREIGYTQDAANQAQVAGRAAGSGGVLNVAALRELTMTTDKSLKDLDQRRQELILQNNAQGAAQISALQIQALDFKQKAEQQTFANLLGMANFSVQASQEKRLSQAQSFTERNNMASMAAQYGVTIGVNDTLETVAARAAQTASTREKAEIGRIIADTRRANADTQKMLRGETVRNVSPEMITTLADSYLKFDPESKNAELIRNSVPNDKVGEFYSEMIRLSNEKFEKQNQADNKARFAEQESKANAPYGLPSDLGYALGNTFNALSSVSGYIKGYKTGQKGSVVYNKEKRKFEIVK